MSNDNRKRSLKKLNKGFDDQSVWKDRNIRDITREFDKKEIRQQLIDVDQYYNDVTINTTVRSGDSYAN